MVGSLFGKFTATFATKDKTDPVKVSNLKYGNPNKACSRECSDNRPDNKQVEGGHNYVRNHRVKGITGEKFNSLTVESFAYSEKSQAYSMLPLTQRIP